MKELSLVLMILSLAFSLIGCGRKSIRVIPVQPLGAEQTQTEQNQAEQTQTEQTHTEETQTAQADDEGDSGEATDQSQGISDMSGISGLMSSMLENSWPTDALPSELPEYAEGEYVNSGGSADDYYVLVENTDQDALDRYLAALNAAGWIVSTSTNDGIAMLGVYEVVFGWRNSDATHLQINVRTALAGQWLYDDIPPDILPPETGTLATAMTLEGSDEDGRYISFTMDGMDEAEAMDYFQLLVENGWSGEYPMVFKDIDWNGKRYSASIAIYEIVDTRSIFSCDLWLAE